MVEENRVWEASWIWIGSEYDTTADSEHQLVHFRRTFHITEEKGCRLTVDVTADSRYRLFLNGQSISVGPCKGDHHTHYYETVDLSDKLIAGKNVLSAQVLHYKGKLPWQMGRSGPISVWHASCGGFLLEGALMDRDGNLIDKLDTDQKWNCRIASGFKIVPAESIQWLGGLECVDGSGMNHGWKLLEFDDSDWAQAVVILKLDDRYGQLSPWTLASRPIPQLYESFKPFKRIVRCSKVVKPTVKQILHNQANNSGRKIPAIEVIPGEQLVIELDAGELTTGYLSLQISEGRKSRIRILCAECYEPNHSGKGAARIKSIRNQDTDGKLVGDYDCYYPAGVGLDDSPETYESFSFRTFRFVRLEVNAGEEPLFIHSFGYLETGYPLQVEGSFQCSDDGLNKLWEMSVRTLKRCMHETYEDCPYYEQLQYTMDARLQMLFTYHLSTDDRLARRAIHDFHSSMLPSGMLQSRYPSMFTQVIPSFSIYWIYMLSEHYRYFGDLELVLRYRPTMLAVIDWFDRMLTEDGIINVKKPAYWTYFDWVEGWPNGAPPAASDEPLSLYSLMFSAALLQASQLLKETGWKDAADELKQKSQRINEAVNRIFWSDNQKLYRNCASTDDFSQHAQIWAVLCGAIQGEEATALMQRTMEDKTLAKLSLPATYQLFRALEMTSLYGQYSFDQWQRWRSFLGLQLTTLPEKAHGTPRSDCHAWSALPLSEFPRNLLGVTPAEPGFKVIAIRPKIAGLEWVKGTVATPIGPVHVFWQNTKGHFKLQVDCPDNTPIIVECPDGRLFHSARGGTIVI